MQITCEKKNLWCKISTSEGVNMVENQTLANWAGRQELEKAVKRPDN